MAERNYRLTEAGRAAWEGQDVAVPADYRRILWMMDFHAEGGLADSLLAMYPRAMLDEWLGEMEEIGLIEPVPEGEASTGDFGARQIDKTLKVDQRRLKEAGKAACQGQPRFPQLCKLNLPHLVHDSVVSSARTRPAFSFSLSR